MASGRWWWRTTTARKSNTKTTYVEVVFMLGVCGRCRTRKHTHEGCFPCSACAERHQTWKRTQNGWFPCWACAERVSNTKTTYVEVAFVLGVCGRCRTRSTPTKGGFRAWCVLGMCGRAVVVFFVSHYHFNAIRGNDPSHRIETAMTQRERTTGGPLSLCPTCKLP